MKTFRELLLIEVDKSNLLYKDAAKQIGISAQYLSDLIAGNRTPSVAVTNKICEWVANRRMIRGNQDFWKILPKWHRAAAKSNGWLI